MTNWGGKYKGTKNLSQIAGNWICGSTEIGNFYLTGYKRYQMALWCMFFTMTFGRLWWGPEAFETRLMVLLSCEFSCALLKQWSQRLVSYRIVFWCIYFTLAEGPSKGATTFLEGKEGDIWTPTFSNYDAWTAFGLQLGLLWYLSFLCLGM